MLLQDHGATSAAETTTTAASETTVADAATDCAWVPGLVEFEPVSIALRTSPADDATIFGTAALDYP